MTSIAGVGRADMTRRFAVTTGAGTTAADLIVINTDCRAKRIRTMARITLIGRSNMPRRFPGRIFTVMTGEAADTGAQLIVIEATDNRPRSRDMAGSAVIGCGNVPRRFTGRLHAVVTRLAARIRRRVIHKCADVKTTRRVAGIALGNRNDVSKVFAARGFAIVAAVALFGQALEYAVAVARLAGN